MMTSTDFCPVCGAANASAQTHCFACGRFLAIETVRMPDELLLVDRYRLGTVVGSGGFSTVYRAQDRQEGGQDVAIKRINLQGLNAEEKIEATHTFHRELSMLSALTHPQVPRLYDHFSDQDHWYLVLEYLEGQTLDAYLAKREGEGKRLQMEEILDIAVQLCTVLDYLHSRQPVIIFRDLKPGNILRTPGGKLYLIDFGIARHYQPGQAQDTQRLGSPGYAAPEQYGRAQTTPQADIYSLGALLHFLLSGQDPANSPLGHPPLRLQSQQGLAELEMLVAQMLSPHPTERPASVRAVAKTLDQIKQHVGTADARRVWMPPPSQPPLPSDGPQLHIQFPPSAGLVWPPSVPSVSRRGWLSRRRVLITLGALTAAIGAGVAIRWSAFPVYQKQAGYFITWSPDSQGIASSSSDNTVQIWSATDGRTIRTYHGESDGGEVLPLPVSWSPDGKHFASIFAGKEALAYRVQIWNASDGRTTVISGQFHTDLSGTASWCPESRSIASTTDAPATVQVWDAMNGEIIVTCSGHADTIIAVAWSPHGEHIASAAIDHTARVWDAATGENVLIYQEHANHVNDVAWSPDGKRLASASSDNTVHIWDATTGKTTLIYRGHSYWVEKVAWSPDGKYIASASDDYTVQVWDVTTGETISTYQSYLNLYSTIAWSPNGKYLAWSSKNIEVWEAP